MAAPCNKYSFCRTHGLAPFCTKTNLRENRFFAARWAIGWRKGLLTMLNFLLKTRQKRLYRIHAFKQRHEKDVRLGQPTRAVAGHAVHDQQKQQHGNRTNAQLPLTSPPQQSS